MAWERWPSGLRRQSRKLLRLIASASSNLALSANKIAARFYKRSNSSSGARYLTKIAELLLNGEMSELAEGARLEIVCAVKRGTEGSNPSLSAIKSLRDFI